MAWIKVEDSLPAPEDKSAILVYWTNGNTQERHVLAAFYGQPYKEPGSERTFLDLDLNRLSGKVTHWQLFPEPPEDAQ